MRKNVRQTITKHPDLACVVGMNAQHGPILLNVLKDLEKLDQIKLVTFDFMDETLAGIEEGHIYATIAQDPYKYGYEAVATLGQLCRGEETERANRRARFDLRRCRTGQPRIDR